MNIKQLTLLLCGSFAMCACIQDEALNSEAAIDGCSGADVQLSTINANEKMVDVFVHRGANLAKQQLIFTLPQGATIKPNEIRDEDYGNLYDFTGAEASRQFTVTSENKQFQPVYTVKIRPTELPTFYRFEDLIVANNTPYNIFYEFTPGSSQGVSQVLQWSSGNPGFALTGMADGSSDYPTMQVDNGYRGRCVKLETKDTGSFGAMVRMYIAAGNLFVGNFDVTKALAGQEGALKATTFGFQFYKKPIALKGYYKYKAGDVYSENGKPTSGNKDICDIYAVMYEADDNSFMLDGTNAKSSDKIIYLAQIGDAAKETDEWTEFNLSFEQQNGKSLDPEKLQKGKYKLGIVFSSSIDGAYFKGAVGSTLCVDEVKLICEDE